MEIFELPFRVCLLVVVPMPIKRPRVCVNQCQSCVGSAILADRCREEEICAISMRSTTTTMLELLLLQLLASLGSSSQPLGSNSRLCKTITITNGGYAKHRSISRLHAELSAKVAGCQYVYGDLEILDLGAHYLRLQEPFDDAIRELETDFLDSIVEISGRLFIKHVNLTRITLRNLRTIRGYNHKNVSPFYSMQVWQMKYPTQLELPKLSAILQGSVSMSGEVHSDLYCHLTRSVNWTSLFQNPALQKFINDASKHESACSSVLNCSSSCDTEWSGRQLCWSNGEDGCQSFNGCLERPCRNCYRHPQTGTEECCNTDCLGGCSDRPDGCFTCRDVIQDGVCKDTCSLKSDPNPGTNRVDSFSSSMKRVGHICVNKCEMPFLTSSNEEHCLWECPQTEYPYQGVCKKCTQSPCKSCTITKLIMTDNEAKKLKDENCTIWRTDDSLDVGGVKLSIASLMTLESLEILYCSKFMIRRSERLVQNLGFLKNLKFVSGEFSIMMLKTTYLGLAKLRYAKHLSIWLVSGLCKAWYPSNRIHEITNVKKEFEILYSKISFDNSSEVCRNAACDPQCRDECWGPGPDMCVACRSFEVDGVCYATCKHAGRYQLGTLCLPCHSECDGGCSGPSASECKRCRNLKEDGKCVPCRTFEVDGVCNGTCHRECDGGCSGPSASECKGCRNLIEDDKCVASCSRDRYPSITGICYFVAPERLFAVAIGVGMGVGLLSLLLLVLLAYMHYRNHHV